jgi:putative ABC transport system permease protein
MVKNFLLPALRMLLKNRWHSLINVAGLTLGIACAIVIFAIVRFELSFDRDHLNEERIYRIVTERAPYGDVEYTAGITYPLPDALRQDFPDLEYVTIDDANTAEPVLGIQAEDGSMKLFKEKKFTFADPDYFKIFTYDWLEGSPDLALKEEKTVVLTASVAKKYFGNAPAMGQLISYNNKYQVTVSGVVQDPPSNSSLPYEVIFSTRLGADAHAWTNWGSTSSGINCYVMLKENVSAADFENKLKGWHMKYFTGDEKQNGETMTYFLQPLREVHSDTRFSTHGPNTVSKKTLISLSMIGLLLLVTACINFINLNTVLIINRSKEVGVKKVLGGSKIHLVTTFLGETFIITLVALIISAGITPLFLSLLKSSLGYTLKINFLNDPMLVFFMLALIVVVTLLAGLYPGLKLAAFRPIRALKNRLYETGNEGVSLRRILIGVQIITSQALIICTIIVIRQVDYFSNLPLGLNSSSIVEFELPARKSIDFKLLKERLKALPGVQDITMSNTGSSGKDTWGGDYEVTVKGEVVKGPAQVKFADNDYLKTYQIKLIAGQDLLPSDTAYAFLINESAARAMGFSSPEDAIGARLSIWSRKGPVSGVVKDFNTTSLRDAIVPTVITSNRGSYMLTAARLETSDLAKTLAQIESTWKMTYPSFVFEYEFLDETIKHFYEAEQRTSRLIMIASILAIIIGAVGLLGLVSFSVARRTKEVGIRKTLGASIASIIALFSKEFIWLVVISFAFATPVSYVLMNQWLANFAYHIEPGVMSFMAAMILSAVVVLSTVGLLSYRAGAANPVDALKYE